MEPAAAGGDPLLGRLIGSYVVERKLGEGGMGAVYQLVHPGIGKRLALKVLHPHFAARPDVVQRFFDEARAVNLIRHPNIVDVLDFSTLDDGRPYLTMEHLEGESLAAMLRRRGVLPLAEVRAIVRQVVAALAAAHQAGVVHRDLKPDNIHVVPHEGGARVKVLDFGIAKLDQPTPTPGMAGERTLSGMVLGTPSYMAPEQAMGRTRQIDARSDVYAVGVVIFEMLSGELPYRADSLAALIAQQATAPPARLRELRPDLADDWVAAVERALAREREARFPTMIALGAAIDAASDEPRAAPRGGRPWTALGLAAVVAAAAGATLWIARDRATEAERATPLAPAAAAERETEPARATAPATVPHPDPARATAFDPARATAFDPDAAPGSATETRTEPQPGPTRRPPARQRARAAAAEKRSAKLGTLTIIAIPWAEVKIDGVARGTTPLTIELPAGRHKVVLSNGEKTVRRTATVDPDATTRVEVSLR